MALRIGTHRNPITVFYDSPVLDEAGQPKRDAYGKPLYEEREFARGWAKIEALVMGRPATKERFTAHQVQPEATHTITIRFMRGLKPGMRIRHRGRTFELFGPPVDAEERETHMVLLAKEQVHG